MSKKRGIVISTLNQPKTISKSQSANANLPHPGLHHRLDNLNNEGKEIVYDDNNEQKGARLLESNLLSEDNEKLVNKAYYTYQYPDSEHHQESDKLQDTDEYVIQSMIKRQQIQKQQPKIRQKSKNTHQHQQYTHHEKVKSTNKYLKNAVSNNQKQQILLKKVKTSKTNNQIKIQLAGRPETVKKVSRQFNFEKFKPKPLSFNENMLDKGIQNMPSKRKLRENGQYMSERVNLQRIVSMRINTKQMGDPQSLGENLNSKKLPFRFKDI